MANVRVWFDREGDFLEVRFVEAEGYFRELAEDVFERVDKEGNVTGFAIFNVTRRECESIEIPLPLTVAGPRCSVRQPKAFSARRGGL